MTEKKFITVAVDGGAASGKSTTSRAVAERLNLLHVDTGSYYRAITYLCLQKGVSPLKPDEVQALLGQGEVEAEVSGRNAFIRLHSRLIDETDLRNPEVTDQVSAFAALPEVRRFLVDFQRSLGHVARDHGFSGLIMEGRDIGTVILPDADYKFYLEADTKTRELRRAREGHKDSIGERDRIDSGRKTAPLACAEDAIRIDTSPLTLDEVVDKVCGIIGGIVPSIRPIKEPESFTYKLVRISSRLYFRCLHRVKIIGVENIPATGPFLIAAHHSSYYDPLLFGYPVFRPIFYFARRSLLRFKIVAWFLSGLYVIPVERDTADMGALKRVFNILKQGHGLILFPEGTRSPDGTVRAFKSGVGMIACRFQLPVIPARNFGAFEAFSKKSKFPRLGKALTVVYGEPIMPSDYDPGKKVQDRYEEATDRIRERVIALCPPTR